jgi:VanZ family protein
MHHLPVGRPRRRVLFGGSAGDNGFYIHGEFLLKKRLRKKIERQVRIWAPVFCWAALILSLSSVPYLRSGLRYDYVLRKTAHIVEYFILTLFLFRAMRDSLRLRGLRLFTFPGGLAFLYTLVDEARQLTVPGRVGSFRDVLIDGIGIVVFCVIAMTLLKRTRQPRRKLIRPENSAQLPAAV